MLEVVFGGLAAGKCCDLNRVQCLCTVFETLYNVPFTCSHAPKSPQASLTKRMNGIFWHSDATSFCISFSKAMQQVGEANHICQNHVGYMPVYVQMVLG